MQDKQQMEDLKDFFIEQRAEIYEHELRVWHVIGQFAASLKPAERKILAQTLKKHLSEIETAAKFYRKYPEFESFDFDKATTWAKVKRQFGMLEKRPRPKIKGVIDRITKRKSKNLEEMRKAPNEMFRRFMSGRVSEDDELMRELYAEDEKESPKR